MKTIFKKTGALVLISISIFSCSKSDDNKPTPTTETPINVTVTTFAGSTQGDAQGNGTAAKFNGPALMSINKAGVLYVADFYNSKVKRIDKVAYSTEIVLPANSLLNPYGITTYGLPNGNDKIFVTDSGNHKIKEITYDSTSTIETIAGISIGDVNGSVGLAKFNNPIGIAYSNGNLFTADCGNHKIKEIVYSAGTNNVNLVVGNTAGDKDDSGTNALMNRPYGIIADSGGNLYFADTANSKIKKVTFPGNVVKTIAGSTAGDADGNAAAAKFNEPQGLAIDGAGNIYIADTGNHKIKKISTSGVVTTIAGSTVGDQNGDGLSAKFNSPVGIVVDASGNLFISDFFNHKIKKITFN